MPVEMDFSRDIPPGTQPSCEDALTDCEFLLYLGKKERDIRLTVATYLFSNMMRVPYFRPTPFERAPKSPLARLFWKSRGLK
jgi:hypothetical protein